MSSLSIDTPILTKVKTFLEQWVIFSFSGRLKFGIKVSLSLMLAYMIPLAMGWDQASTAAMTVMLIATTGVVGESVMKGTVRVIGTVIGAVIGMTLIALFPQERMTYLLLLSLIVPFVLYLYNVYQGDSTVFMLTAVMILMVFDGGQVDDVFLYGVDRTYMTIFGIVIYTLVGLFLWPVKESDTTIEDACELTSVHRKLFTETLQKGAHSEREKLLSDMATIEQKLQRSHFKAGSSSVEMTLNKKIWDSITHTYKGIGGLLNILSTHTQENDALAYARYIRGYDEINQEIIRLFDACEASWKTQGTVSIPQERMLDYEEERLHLTHLQRSAVVAHAEILQKLHMRLRLLADRLNQLQGADATIAYDEKVTPAPRFVWLDPEYLRGFVQTFLIFWSAAAMWIYFNPPGGFLVVTLATLLSVLTSFSPLKPSLLTILFSFGFLYAIVMYVFVLPNLVYEWQLALFIFVYTFIAFYLINPKVSIFFLLGMFTLNITNEMYYRFDIFLITLLVFYLFLSVLMLFYYIPFSTKPEHLFLRMVQRLYHHATRLLLIEGKRSWSQQKIDAFYLLHMQRSAAKLTLWASQIDIKLFAPNTKEALMAFCAASNRLATNITYLIQYEAALKEGKLLKKVQKEHADKILSTITKEISELNDHDLEPLFRQGREMMQKIEQRIESTKARLDPDAHSKEEITAFYIDIDIRHSVWRSLQRCHESFEALDIETLQKNRF